MPERLQLSRRKGWRLPANAVNVARPTRYGNPFHVKPATGAGPDRWQVVNEFGPLRRITEGIETRTFTRHEAHQLAVDAYWAMLQQMEPGQQILWRARLYRHELACWCPLDLPCHADLLLEVMNA